jgi:hypothetical protein
MSFCPADHFQWRPGFSLPSRPSFDLLKNVSSSATEAGVDRAPAALIEPVHNVDQPVTNPVCRDLGFGRGFAATFQAIPGPTRQTDRLQGLESC